MAMKRVAIGGKGSSLTPSSVYFIANGVSQVNMDSSILIVFIRIREPSSLESLEFGSALGFLDSLCKVKGKRIEDVGVTDGEISVLEESCYALDGICAPLDCCSSSLSTVADAVAGLSCEASRAYVCALVNLSDSGDGFSDKEMVVFASEFKVLLTGSKLVGENGSKAVSETPEVHGSFREIVKQVHSTMRVKLDSSSLASSLIYLGESSLCRAELVARCQDVDIHSAVLEMSDTLKTNGINLSFGFKRESSRGSGCKTKKGNANEEKKSQKKKKVVLGKGTAVIMQLLKARLNSEGEDTLENLAVLNEWARDICLFFEPKDPELDTFLKKVKDMVTRNFAEEKYAIKKKAFKIIEEVFERHGVTALKTPIFELRETLMGKYGEDSKLVYDLADQGTKLIRRENTTKGQYREFYQCDFDNAGQYESAMAPDSEVANIELSHRKLLDGMLEISGVPPEKFRTICSKKGLTAEVADKIATLVKKRGPPLELLSELKQDRQFLENNGSSLVLKDLEILFEAFEKSKCIDRVVFDLSLARDLDYYTGVPAVGVSLGIEQVYDIMEEQQHLGKDGIQSIRATETEVLVSIYEKGTLGQAAELVSEMWVANIKIEFMVHKKLDKHIDEAKKSRIPSANQVRTKDMQANKEDLVDRDSVVKEVQRRLKLSNRI
ncbi:hypothetical protein MKX01_003246 [Papaver californicum]|nr:hypothetical protein MKX01_003246 [Papaver californicum]